MSFQMANCTHCQTFGTNILISVWSTDVPTGVMLSLFDIFTSCLKAYWLFTTLTLRFHLFLTSSRSLPYKLSPSPGQVPIYRYQ